MLDGVSGTPKDVEMVKKFNNDLKNKKIKFNSYIFTIDGDIGGRKIVVIESNNLEEAIQKAKVESLSDLKEFKSDEHIINMFHRLNYRFVHTVLVKGTDYKIDIL